VASANTESQESHETQENESFDESVDQTAEQFDQIHIDTKVPNPQMQHRDQRTYAADSNQPTEDIAGEENDLSGLSNLSSSSSQSYSQPRPQPRQPQPRPQPAPQPLHSRSQSFGSNPNNSNNNNNNNSKRAPSLSNKSGPNAVPPQAGPNFGYPAASSSTYQLGSGGGGGSGGSAGSSQRRLSESKKDTGSNVSFFRPQPHGEATKYNQGWKSSAPRAVNEALKSAPGIDCIGLGPGSTFVVLTTAKAEVHGYSRLADKLRDLIQKNKAIKWVAVGANNTYVVLYGRNGWASNGPEALTNKLNDLSDKREEITCVALGPDDTYAVTYGSNAYATNAHKAVKDKLGDLNSKGRHIQGIALGPDNSYAVWFDGYCYSTNGPQGLKDALDKVFSQKASIDVITLGPDDSYALAYGKKQY